MVDELVGPWLLQQPLQLYFSFLECRGSTSFNVVSLIHEGHSTLHCPHPCRQPFSWVTVTFTGDDSACCSTTGYRGSSLAFVKVKELLSTNCTEYANLCSLTQHSLTIWSKNSMIPRYTQIMWHVHMHCSIQHYVFIWCTSHLSRITLEANSSSVSSHFTISWREVEIWYGQSLKFPSISA